ncbi:MAG: hypothetical protein PF482_13415 [Desulfobacteraceae bacterium]|jgi:hypothetical protein|nr:hypothetical protein [Desulfobacteraceae bacterium]
MIKLNRFEKDVIIFHTIFTILCGIVILAFSDIAIGQRLFFLVIVYNLVMPAWGFFRKDKDWTNLWLFTFILSMFQVFPDWFLSAQLNILVFPEDGCFKFGTVSGYMAGLWTIPLFIILFVGEQINERASKFAAYFSVAIASVIIFGGSEATLWLLPSWYAQNVYMIGHIALYILIPEIVLGTSTYACYQTIKAKPHWVKIPAAFIVMQLYLGSACFFYFLIEKIIRGY